MVQRQGERQRDTAREAEMDKKDRRREGQRDRWRERKNG